MTYNKSRIVKPRRVRIDASTTCQLKCPSCPTGTGETQKKLGLGFLKFKDFKNFINNHPWVSIIELSNWGEIFFNEELIEIMKYAHENHISLYADNGVNLNDVKHEVLKAMVRYKFKRITCSIDGASQEIYSIYRVNGGFQKVIENIKNLNKFKTHYRSRYPVLKWQFIPFGHNEIEIAQARKLAGELGMTFFLKLSWENLYTDPFSPIKNADLIKKETGLAVANRTDFREKYGEEYMKSCLGLWTDPQINYDGRVLGCSVNYWGDYGNAFQEGLDKCMNNKKINYAREMLMGRQQDKKDIPCTQCKIFKKMAEQKSWITEENIMQFYVKSRVSILIDKSIVGLKLTERLIRLAIILRLRSRRIFRKFLRKEVQ